jgi:hypothetical protein
MVPLPDAAREQDAYRHEPAVLVITCDPTRAGRATEAVAAAGMRVLRSVGLDEAEAALADSIALDAIAIDTVGVPTARLDALLAGVEAAAEAQGAAVVAAIARDHIDMAGARLLGRGPILCEPDEAERVEALTAARPRRSVQLNDATRDAEAARLQRLNEEVARIADTLARLTRGEEAPPRNGASVRAPGMDFHGPEGRAAPVSAGEVRSVIRARRMRGQFFTGELFADPAWDMLLDLFAADLEQRRVSVSSLCIAAAVPPTTALRWISTMHDAELFERQADPSDRRRAYIALSAKGLDGMRSYAGAIKRAGLSLV